MRNIGKSHLDFTPLLDIVLLLLFVLLMIVASGVKDANASLEEEKDKYSHLEEVSDIALNELNQNLEESKATINLKDKEIIEMGKSLEDYEIAYDSLVEAVSSFLEEDKESILEMLEDSSETKSQVLNELIDTETLAESILKYEVVESQFYFIEVEIKGSNNRIYINDRATSKGISLEEVSEVNLKDDKIKEIRELIEDEMTNRQGGAAMTFVLLKVSDSSVYQYAWNTVWEAIGDLQEKYGTDTLFRTYITTIE